MKLKSILLAVLFCVTLPSCSKDAFNQEKCLKAVSDSFPNAKIYYSLEVKYYFVVIDSSGVSIVKTMNSTKPDVSEVWTMRLAQ